MKRYKPPYYAFISYCGSDEKWAKWLHKKLEYCHIPSELCKEHPNLPKKIRPVFWYKQDLSGTKLRKSLHSELNESKYLIVICSPESAKAFWVNDEVQAFIAQGKGDKIIPFIVSGTPHSPNPKEECFPKALQELSKEEEIRGIDVHRKEGKMHALVDVIATMFGIRFDELWQRHERYQKRKNIIIGCLIALFLSIIFTLFTYLNKLHDENWNKLIDNVTNLTDKALAHGDIRLAKLIILDFTQKYSKDITTKENAQIERLVRKIDFQDQMKSYDLLAYNGYDIIDSKYSGNGDTIYVYDRVEYDKAICTLWSDANGKYIGSKDFPIYENKQVLFKYSNYDVLLKNRNISIYNKLGKLVYSVPIKYDIERIFFDEDRLCLYMVYENSKKNFVEYNLQTNKECAIVDLGGENECLNIFCDKRKNIYIATSKTGIGIYNTRTKATENFMTIPLLTSVKKSPVKDEIIATTKNSAYQIALSNQNIIKIASRHNCNYIFKIDIDYTGNLLLVKKLNLTRQKNGKLKGTPCVEIWSLKTKQLIHSLILNKFTENNFHNVEVQITSDKNILLTYGNILEVINWENGTNKCITLEDSLIYNAQLLKYGQELLVNYKYLYDCKHLHLLETESLPYKASYNLQKTMFAYKDQGLIRIFDSSHKLQEELKDNTDNRFSNLMISNDNLHLADFEEGNLCIWNLKNKKLCSVSQLSKTYKKIQIFGNYYLVKGNDHFAIIDKSGQIIYEHTASQPEFFAASEDGKCIVLVEGNYGVEKPILAIKIRIQSVNRILHTWKRTLKGRFINNNEITKLQNL